MKKNQSGPVSILPPARKALSYARVSSKEQEKEGFSIPAQQKLLQAYADQNGIVVEREFVDVETAKHTGRQNFEEMVRYLKRHEAVRLVLVEKTDRLYRNLKDWVTLDELDIEIHLIKEGVVLSRESKSSEKFVHGIKVLMAKNYIDNLSEEARKGQQEKAEQGIWPTKAPRGYINTTGPNGKKIIVPDPKTAGAITHLFGWYASGTLSLKELALRAKSAGLTYRSTGKPLPTSGIHQILRNRLYTGEFNWKGHLYKGRHAPLITRELWERVQGVLDGRNAKKPKSGKPEFAFAGMISCGHCGCAMTGEIKKRRYIYYHCTGYKGKCPEPYVREEILGERFSDVLAKLDFGESTLGWMTTALRESHGDEQKEHEAAIARLKGEHERLQNRIHAMYLDKLDGRVDRAFFERMSSEWRSEQERCLREMGWHQSADQAYLEDGIQLLDLAQKASRLFAKQEPEQKRRLLKFVLSNSTWKNGELAATFRQPFDLIAQTASGPGGGGGKNGAGLSGHTVWLGNLDAKPDS
ncbi:recombinase family protein [Rhodopseudomonas sp.]|uniref:recombinase family protein n=1 Tax=Rhodopseudomonas sp. TaxID=1078 RepID=UPI0039E407C0